MKPYYREAGVTIYHGDCREILPSLSAESVITDPVWPRPLKMLAGSGRPYELFAEMCGLLPPAVVRMVVHLNCVSDPRFLDCMPPRLPFFRTCWLPIIPCGFVGRALNSGDVAYAFGEPPKGTGIIPGECLSAERAIYPRSHGRNRSQRSYAASHLDLPHPAVRKLKHVRWLAKHFGGASVIDPFGGSGTTAVACKALGIPCTLIEIEEKYCALAVGRLKQDSLDLQVSAFAEAAS